MLLSLFIRLAIAGILSLTAAFSPAKPPAAIPTPEAVSPDHILYLTFDADMTAGMKAREASGQVLHWYDPEIVSFLKEQDVASTFFVTGLFAQTNPDLIKELADDPRFEVENHSFDHRAFGSGCYRLEMVKSDEDKKMEITKTQEVFRALNVRAPKLFRFPGLCGSQKDQELVQALGLKPIGADIVSQDAFSHNPKAISERLLKDAKGGSIVLMHMGGPNAPATLQALKTAIPELKSRGFVFKTL